MRQEQDDASESSVLVRVGIIANAQKLYATRHPDRGYSCTIATLFSPESGNISGEGGFVHDRGQGSEEWNGYRFVLPAAIRILDPNFA